MITQSIQMFSKDEEEMVRILQKAGMQQHIAKTLVYLLHVPGATSREMERGADMRQSEVSMAVRELTDQGFVTCEQEQSERKGRPVHRYQLTMAPAAVVDALEAKKKEELQLVVGKIRRLKKMA